MYSVVEMRVQQAEQDPSPLQIEPLVALVDRLGLLVWHFYSVVLFEHCVACAIFHSYSHSVTVLSAL